MRKVFSLMVGFCIICIFLPFLFTVLNNRKKITIPNTYKTLHYFRKPTILLTGPLIFPQNLAQNVLGLVSVASDDIILFVNKARADVNSPALKPNELLAKAADMRAQTILKHQNFSHQDPFDHIQLDTVMPQVGYSFSYASENIGLGEQDAQSFVNGFMSSPPHRQNLLDKNLIETGVGVAQGRFDDRDVTIVVQIFATPAPTSYARGYSDSEGQNLKNLLSGLNENLDRTRAYLIGQPTSVYYLGWEKLLQRQIYLVQSVLAVVEKGQHYTDRERQFIAEYNNNWQKAPK